MIKTWFKKITGQHALEEKLRAEERLREIAEASAIEARKLQEEAEKIEKYNAMSPKEKATSKGEPWVSVLETHINKENIRNGFFELDWNEEFIVELKKSGYGFDGDATEEIVDRWFRDIVRNMLADEGLDTSRGAGYINVVPINKGRSEVS